MPKASARTAISASTTNPNDTEVTLSDSIPMKKGIVLFEAQSLTL